MAQSPFQVDAVQIEQTIHLGKDATTGGLRLMDGVLTSGVLLQALASLRAIEGVFLVGRGGEGAAYTTLQSAVDAIPATSSPTAPNLILMLPGVYVENVMVEKDGIEVVALGHVVLQAAASAPTITIQGGVTIPTYCALRGLTIANAFDGQSCVSVLGGALSTVGLEGIYLQDCRLNATGIGTRQLYCSTVNNISVEGGLWAGSPTSLTVVDQCASFVVDSLQTGLAFQLSYNNGLSSPSVTTSVCRLQSSRLGNVVSTLAGEGSLIVANCSEIGDLTLSGNRSASLVASKIGDLTVNVGASVAALGVSRGSASGSGTLDEPLLRGSVVFSAESSKAVVFDVPQSDSDYSVSLDKDIDARVTVPSKAGTGFTIAFPAGPQTGAVGWAVHRIVTL